MTSFYSKVTRIGGSVPEFIQAGILVLFREQVPPELQDIAILHAPSTFQQEVATGQVLRLGAAKFRVTAVGSVANRNLRELGHAVIKFNGLTAPELPGDLCVEALAIPDLKIGDPILISEQ